VVMPRQDRDTCPTLPVPDPNRLVVRRRDDPRLFGVEVDGTDVVEVAVESEEAAAGFVAARVGKWNRWGGRFRC
jgi:hypothetical protein